MINHAIWNPLLDSLHYYQKGNYQTFSLCFQRSIEYLNLQSSSTIENKLKQRFFYTLNRLGFLEIDTTSPLNYWTVSPIHAVKLKEEYILIAPPYFMLGLTSISRSDPHEFYIYDNNNNNQPHCRVAMEKYSINDRNGISTLRSLNIPLVDRTSWKYLHNTPSIQTISELFLDSIDHVPSSVISTGQKFDFSQSKWIDVEPTSSHQLGLYRIPVKENFSQLLLKVNNENELKHFRITNNEWALLISAKMLGINLRCRYNKETRDFSYRTGTVLPTIIERILISHSFINPKYSDGFFVYKDVPHQTINILNTEYPYLFEGTN